MDIKVKDLQDTQTVTTSNQIMVLTNDANNLVENITIGDLVNNTISADSDNLVEQGTDDKFFVKNTVGDLTTLTTINKTTAVAAINEVKSDLGTTDTNIGDLAELDTTDKDSVVDAINELNSIINPTLQYNAMNNSKAMKTGALSNDTTIFPDILTYAHSTFDASKFTSLKVGSPVISADGIASGLGNNNYFNTGIVIGNKPFSITLKASWTGSITGQRIFQLGLGTYQKFSCYVQNNTNLQFGGTLSDSTTFNKAISNISGDVIINSVFDGSKYVLKASSDNGKTWSSNEYTSNLFIENVDSLSLYLGNNFPAGTIDLKYLSVVVDGVTVLNGNITATDTYTIGGSTVSIPFTWSKTGSKIVDASQSTNLTNLYNQEGDAPYYMLDEANKQFALPMGELYGFIRRAGNDYSKPNFDSGVTITSPYTVEGGGWIHVQLDYFYNGAEFVANIDSTNNVIRYKNNAEVDHGSATTFLIPVQIGQVFTAVINNAQAGTTAVYKYFKNKGV